jgi:hypothetical protein
MTQEAADDWPVGDCRDVPQGPLLTPWVSPHVSLFSLSGFMATFGDVPL